jgi:WYL_2, Sm-like SH3 beta-barrel fold
MIYTADIMNGFLNTNGLPIHRVQQLDEICDVVMDPKLMSSAAALYKGLTVDTKPLPVKAPMARQDDAPFITFVEAIQPTDLRPALEAGEVQVDFVKEDGTAVTMRCTTNPALMPVHARPRPLTEQASVNKPTKQVDPNLFKVYALDRQGWRSFKLDRVTKIEAIA